MVAHISNQAIPVLPEMLAHLVLCLDEFYLVTKLDRFFFMGSRCEATFKH